ncbi:hypothetical protein H9P43_000886 [Blastocladiella emersonii ATCC 22665]|nr:hypothetical protein H9P43_000886 [Blastocladiella emersonii ATCC 22665]
MAYIPAELRGNLRKYKYAGADHSLVSRYVLQPYWNWLVTLVPMWMAPNLVTLIGFSFILLNVALTLFFSPDLVTPLPSWCYYLFGFGLFMYQSLDAIDGKQARRTGQSGPLGELFDHGCDALNTTLTVLTVAPALGYGKSWWMLLSMASTLANFFLTTWEEYHTGVLYLGFFSGPVEGILMVVATFFVTGYFGPEFWQQAVPGSNGAVTLMEATMVLGLAVIGLNIFNSAVNVVRASKLRGEQGASPAAALAGLAPFAISVVLVYLWAASNPAIIADHLVPLTLYVTFFFGHLVGRIITAHVIKAPYPYGNVNWIPAVLALGNVASGWLLGGGERLVPAEYDGLLLWVSVGFSMTVYARFALGVIGDICDELDIWCLTIKHPQGQDKKKAQ